MGSDSLHIYNIYIHVPFTDVTIGFVEARVRVSEGSGTALVVKVVKSGSTTERASVAFMTEDGTGRSGVDYTPLHGVLEYSATDSEKEIEISIIDDSVFEGEEYFALILSLPDVGRTGLALARERLLIEIEDDDSKPTIYWSTLRTNYYIHSLNIVQWDIFLLCMIINTVVLYCKTMFLCVQFWR